MEYEIKRLTIKGLFRDDALLDKLVLKGGNALLIVYGMTERGSRDIDLSMVGDFSDQMKVDIDSRLEMNLSKVFREDGFFAFDFKCEEHPQAGKDNIKNLDFWGGYTVTFKVVRKEIHEKYGDDLKALRRNALMIGDNPTIKVEISKHEYCDGKEEHKIDGFVIYVCSLVVIVAEKLRAICQQLEEYRERLHSRPGTGRARDFFDIHNIITTSQIDMNSIENIRIIREIFKAKRVPLTYLDRIDEVKELHNNDFSSLILTVKDPSRLKSFDYYFNYVKDLISKLKPLREENLPSS